MDNPRCCRWKGLGGQSTVAPHAAHTIPAMNEGGPPARDARSSSPLILPHVMSEQSSASTSGTNEAGQPARAKDMGKTWWTGFACSPRGGERGDFRERIEQTVSLFHGKI